MVAGGKTPDLNARGYTQIMKEQILKGEENEVNDINGKTVYLIENHLFLSIFQLRKKLLEKSKDGSLKVTNGDSKTVPKKRGRWDQTEEVAVPAKKKTLAVSTSSTAATPIWDGDVSKLLYSFHIC